jgi:hypothetical protein
LQILLKQNKICQSSLWDCSLSSICDYSSWNVTSQYGKQIPMVQRNALPTSSVSNLVLAAKPNI